MFGRSTDEECMQCAFFKVIVHPAHSASGTGIIAFCVVQGQALKINVSPDCNGI
jgi:hypothetical protein